MASPNVSFDSIPASIRHPGQYFEFNTRLATNTLPANKNKLLLIGQRLTPPSDWVASTAYSAGAMVKPVVSNGHYYICSTAGTSGANAPTWPLGHGLTVTDGTAVWTEYAAADASKAITTVYQLFSDADARDYFGEGSALHLSAKAALAANPYLALYGIAMADNGTTRATATVTIANAATGAGWVKLWVGDVLVEISIASGDTASAIASALCAAINQTRDLPVIASVSSAVVTLTARNAGTIGNQVKLERTYALGVGTTVTLSAATLSNGATDPNIQTPLDAVLPEQYHVVCSSLNDAGDEAAATHLAKIRTHLNSASGPVEQRPGVAVVGYVGTIANAQTLADTLNHGRTVIAHLKSSRSEAYKIGAAMAGLLAGSEDPAQPLNGLVLARIAAPVIADRTTWTEANTMLSNGVTPLVVSSELVAVCRTVTTYQTDISFLDITTVRTLDYVRQACRERIALRYPRAKLFTGQEASVRSELYSVLKALESMQIVENVDALADGLLVERDTQDPNRLNAKIPADVVNGLHVFAGRIDLIL